MGGRRFSRGFALLALLLCVAVAPPSISFCDKSGLQAPHSRSLFAAASVVLGNDVFTDGSISAAYASSSWCHNPQVSFSTTLRNARGVTAKVIAYTPKGGCGMQLYRRRFRYLQLRSYKSVTMLLNGGSKGGQQLQVGITASTGRRYTAPLAPYLPNRRLQAGRWRRVTVPLTAFRGMNPASVKLHSVYLIPDGADTQPQLYVDGIVILLKSPRGSEPAPTPRPTPRPTLQPTPAPQPTGTQRLHTSGNGIFTADGRRWRGRGVNVADPRSNSQCWPIGTDLAQTAPEVSRRIDAAVRWGGNVIRLTLENHAAANDGFAAGPSPYLDAIQTIAEGVGTDHPGVYLMVSFWQDPTLSTGDQAGTNAGWPTAGTNQRWTRLVSYLARMPHVIFGVVNEPEANYDGAHDAACWTAMNSAVAAIRAAESAAGVPQHLIAVQGTRNWARHLDFYIKHPITAGGGTNIAYETHVYNHAEDFDALVTQPAKSLPVVVGEFGPAQISGTEVQSIAEAQQLMALTESLGVPWIAWSFSEENDPSMLLPATRPAGAGKERYGCHVGANAIALQPNDWGTAVKQRLARPYNT